MFEALSALRSLRSPAGDALNVYTKIVFTLLVSHADAAGCAWPSQDRLALEASCSRRQVQRAVADLRTRGWISTATVTDQNGKHDVHTLTPPVATERKRERVSRRAEGGAYQSSPPGVAPVGRHGGVAPTSPGGGACQSSGVAPTSPPICPSDLPIDLPIVSATPPAVAERGVSLPLPGLPGLPAPTETTTPKVTKKPAKVTKVTKAKKPLEPNGDHAAVIAHWCSAYERTKGVAPIVGSRNAKAAKELLSKLSVDDAKAVIDRAFADTWFATNQGELFNVSGNVNKYRGTAPRSKSDVHQRARSTGRTWSEGDADQPDRRSARVAG